ncbi:hypothetical protein MZO42_07580 [Sphingomonas psychrotolerans]|uniref:Uncharacterized protein n=1 Tax=Sphingomonas psychrotolerans TaxID=1327635 RepID=A0ABU3N1X0_9SPHN|nr:hypothetical protein [Sphingomonas psychrotolerans]MDT8758554.1 hypothetical protein [Sphingomonas psychrotolerans]
MVLKFEKAEDGWIAEGGKYQMRYEGQRVGMRFVLSVNGTREASFFASGPQRLGADEPEYLWTIGTSERAAQTGVGRESYATIYHAFFEAYQSLFKLPPGQVSLAFDPQLEKKEWDRWGP